MKTVDDLRRLLLAPATGPVCVVMGVTMLFFGLSFLNPLPHPFFARIPFRGLHAVGPEMVWGLMLVLVGAWRVAAALKGSYAMRTLSTATAISVWCFLFFLFLTSEPSNPWTFVLGPWTGLESWTLFRLRRHVPALLDG